MTVHHLVLFDFDPGLTDTQAAELFARIDALLRQIPGVTDVKLGKNFTTRAPGVTHAAVVTMKDKQALAGYGPHPKHVEVQGLLKPHLKNLSVVDIET